MHLKGNAARVRVNTPINTSSEIRRYDTCIGYRGRKYVDRICLGIVVAYSGGNILSSENLQMMDRF